MVPYNRGTVLPLWYRITQDSTYEHVVCWTDLGYIFPKCYLKSLLAHDFRQEKPFCEREDLRQKRHYYMSRFLQ